ncbi:MAG: hypothetical protein K2P92_05015 [Bdellovibrionaceae bacterium]|nr:hypothetical protein [Pseudobdellovibrionaceae bacterium]
MEFEIKDLEIIDPVNNTISREGNSTSGKDQIHIQNSMILKELHAENEELHAKIKLNHRRLLLFETENNKLVEEKNKLFFEVQDYLQKNQMLTERNEELTRQNDTAIGSEKLLLEKMQTLESINQTQMAEIKRFSKFHAKIQEVVKPLVTRLKDQLTETREELTRSQKMNSHLNGVLHDLKHTTEIELSKREHTISQLSAERNGLTQTYEEQIHSFSKEILALQSQNEEQEKEIARLKKVTEFKNYFENEVIRFKRTHEEDQQVIRDLSQKKAQADTRMLTVEQSLLEARSEAAQLKSRFNEVESTLEVTREQLTKKIDELSNCYERLSRLEKLNTQLSLEMSDSNKTKGF